MYCKIIDLKILRNNENRSFGVKRPYRVDSSLIYTEFNTMLIVEYTCHFILIFEKVTIKMQNAVICGKKVNQGRYRRQTFFHL